MDETTATEAAPARAPVETGFRGTPGAWEVVRGSGWLAVGPAGRPFAPLIADVHGCEGYAANAQLISAAPELLAALVTLLARFDGTQMHDPDAFPEVAADLRAARLAVAKATTLIPF